MDINQRSEVGGRRSKVPQGTKTPSLSGAGVPSLSRSSFAEAEPRTSRLAGFSERDIPHPPLSTLHTLLSPRSGQAMIEVMVGMIALLVLVAGLLQVASLTKAQTDTMVEAREDAGRRAFWDMPLSESPEYIRNIEAGPDGRTYSLDDTTTLASGGRFHSDIIAHTVSAEDQWDILEELPDQSFPTLNNAATPISTFGLLKGSASRTVTLRPAVRSLIYRAEEIEIESDVWMTWTKGIY